MYMKSGFDVRLICALLFCVSLTLGCSQPVSKTVGGTLAGAALGAGTGAIVGGASGHAGPGVAIGAGIGALGGALAGSAMDKMDQENADMEAQLKHSQELIDENARLIDELKKRGADARSSKRGVVVNLPDILFRFDRADLTPEAVRTIGEISGVLQGAQHRALSVEGHTDSVGNVVYNKQLSERRAQSVAKQLSKDGISGQRITAKGFGEGAPIATNNTEAGRSRNRRVEIIVENN
jgi:outer membrane protein OmpA-like peptidoglycan-associated protein